MRSSSVAPGRRSRARPSRIGVGEGPVPELVDEHRPQPVAQHQPRLRLEQHHVVRDADLRAGVGRPQGGGRGGVAAQEARERPHRLRGRLLLRRPAAEDVAHVHLHVRLVERDPEVDAGTEPPSGLGREPREALGEVRRRDAAAVRHPERQGEVQERHRGRDPRLAQLPHEVAVAGPRLLVPGALLRLEAAPLDREAVGVGADRLHERHVLRHAVPVVGGDGARLAALDRPRLRLEAGPVVGVAALDLVGRRGRAPEEALRERRRRAGQILGGEGDAGVGHRQVRADAEPGHDQDAQDPAEHAQKPPHRRRLTFPCAPTPPPSGPRGPAPRASPTARASP